MPASTSPRRYKPSTLSRSRGSASSNQGGVRGHSVALERDSTSSEEDDRHGSCYSGLLRP